MTTMTRWNPYNELERLQSRVLRAMNLGENGSENDSLLQSADWAPAVDITETEKEYEITADLPQIAKEDVKLVVENGSLIMKGERQREAEHKDKKVHRIERSYGSFYRSFSLPDDADGSGISAKFKDGVLKVLLPKNEEKLPKQIEVQVD